MRIKKQLIQYERERGGKREGGREEGREGKRRTSHTGQKRDGQILFVLHDNERLLPPVWLTRLGEDKVQGATLQADPVR